MVESEKRWRKDLLDGVRDYFFGKCFIVQAQGFSCQRGRLANRN
jgi:hypothetical protein